MDLENHIMWKLMNFLNCKCVVSAHWLNSTRQDQPSFNGNPVEENENVSLARFAKLFELNLFPRKLLGATTLDWVSEWILTWNLMKLPDLSVMVVICQVGNSAPSRLESKKYPRWRRPKVVEELNQDKLYLRPPLSAAPSPPLRIWMKSIVLPTIPCFRALRISTGTSQEWEEADQRWEALLTEVFLLFLARGRIIV